MNDNMIERLKKVERELLYSKIAVGIVLAALITGASNPKHLDLELLTADQIVTRDLVIASAPHTIEPKDSGRFMIDSTGYAQLVVTNGAGGNIASIGVTDDSAQIAVRDLKTGSATLMARRKDAALFVSDDKQQLKWISGIDARKIGRAGAMDDSGKVVWQTTTR